MWKDESRLSSRLQEVEQSIVNLCSVLDLMYVSAELRLVFTLYTHSVLFSENNQSVWTAHSPIFKKKKYKPTLSYIPGGLKRNVGLL